MKRIEDYINEELILERVVGFFNLQKITFDMPGHSEERQYRDEKSFVPKRQILSSVAKVAKDIKDDLSVKIISIGDRIQIIDKSRKPILNVLCDILEDKQKEEWIKMVIITVKEGNMPTHDIKKIYTTYINDKRLKDDIKLLKDEI